MKKYSVRFCIVCILSVVAMLVKANIIVADTEVKSVAVFPFEVISKDDIGFIGKGMGKMLCSRVAAGSSISVRCMDRLPSEYGIDVGSQSLLEKTAGIADLNGVDYILTGTITVAGENVSSDARLVNVMRPEQTKYINVTGTGMGVIMEHASAIADKVNIMVGGGTVGSADSSSTYIPAAAATAASSGVASGKAALSGSTKTSPALSGTTETKDVLSGTASQTDVRPLQKATPFLSASESITLLNKKLDMNVIGLATADIDGDRVADLAVIDDHTLTFYVFRNNTIIRQGEYKDAYYNRNISVDAFDADNDGKNELFVTSIGKNNYIKSYVLKWNGSSFDTVVKDSEWYFRVVGTGRHEKLIGQMRTHDEVFGGKIYYLEMRNGKIVKKGEAGEGVFSVFGFAPVVPSPEAQAQSDSSARAVWFNDSGLLNITDDRGAVEWRSAKTLGSTPLFIDVDNGLNQLKERFYINSRVLLSDLDGDGVDEIVTVENSDAAKGFLSGFRKFTQGRIKVLKWKNGSMEEIWDGNFLTDYISDFSLRDMDGDGYPEIVLSVVNGGGVVMNRTRSTVFVQKIVSR